MVVIDPIADLLTRIRNAQMAQKDSTIAPYSKVKEAICKVMKESGFIANFSVETNGKFKELAIAFSEERSSLELTRISKPGQRIYITSQEIPKVKNGMGITIISTSKGVMNGFKAKKAGMGGELLCSVA